MLILIIFESDSFEDLQVPGVGEDGPTVFGKFLRQNAVSSLQKFDKHKGIFEFVHDVVIYFLVVSRTVAHRSKLF